MNNHGFMIFSLAAVFVAIVLNNKTKRNTGLYAIAFAYLIGCFGMGMKVSALTQLFFRKDFVPIDVGQPVLRLCGK